MINLNVSFSNISSNSFLLFYMNILMNSSFITADIVVINKFSVFLSAFSKSSWCFFIVLIYALSSSNALDRSVFICSMNGTNYTGMFFTIMSFRV